MIPTDNPLSLIQLNLATLANIAALNMSGSITAEQMPLIIGVEEVKAKDAPDGTPPSAIRYILAFPTSGFMRIAVKVEETQPSITADELAKRGGSVKAAVEDFKSGNMPVDGGGIRPWFKAKAIYPTPTNATGTTPVKSN